MKKTILLKTPLEVLDFIKRDHVTERQACTLVREAFSVFCYPSAKEELIRKCKAYIKRWQGYDGELPFFLDQLEEEFNIKDLYQ